MCKPSILRLCLLRLEPNQAVGLDKLSELGVLYYKLDADSHETDARLAAIRKVRNYSFTVRRWMGVLDDAAHVQYCTSCGPAVAAAAGSAKRGTSPSCDADMRR